MRMEDILKHELIYVLDYLYKVEKESYEAFQRENKAMVKGSAHIFSSLQIIANYIDYESILELRLENHHKKVKTLPTKKLKSS